MKFEELLKTDLGRRAFADFITIEEAKQTGLIPIDYHESFPSICGPKCNSDVIISKNLSTFLCCDPRCPYKVAASLNYLFTHFSCMNVGPKTCETVTFSAYPRLQMRSYLELLNIPESKLPMTLGGSAAHSFMEGVAKIKLTELTFAQIVSRIGIPGFGPNSSVVFEDINSLGEFVEELKRDGVEIFLRRRQVYSPMKAFYLREFLPDIGYAATKVFVRVVPKALLDIPIVVTGKLFPTDVDPERYTPGRKMERETFVRMCNEICTLSETERVLSISLTKARESVEFFIADEDISSSSMNVARRREQEEYTIDPVTKERKPVKLIYTSDQFISFLRQQVKLYKEAKENYSRSLEREEEDL